ncbi:MAG: patatin-like phospholipase family protein [Spirochaetales bacterium]|nr:patatin-like phospholipase family protein [Spirochaetales bacterium]
MFREKPGYALVFAGGGARGAYELGAWKALRELKIKIDAVCGASVGALNAAIVAQDDFDLGLKIWTELSLDKVVKVPDGMIKNGKLKFSLKNFARIGEFNLDIRNLGLDSEPLHNMLKAEIKEERIRKLGMDLGIVTINLNNLQPCEIFLDDMPEGSLPDYLLASASFPAFKRAEINGKQFTDGGMYDNIPHAMMKNRGYKKMIVVDISGLGVNKRPDITGTETIYIKNSMPLGHILDFSPETVTPAISLGYLDTMKVFNRNSGLKYFILPDHKIERYYRGKLLSQKSIDRYSAHLNLSGRKCSPDIAETLIRASLPSDQKSNKDLILCLIEAAAISLDIEKNKLYKLSELIEEIREKYYKIKLSANIPSKKQSESFFEILGDTLTDTLNMLKSERKLGDYCPYEYAKIMRGHKAAGSIFPELAAAEIFLSLLD